MRVDLGESGSWVLTESESKNTNFTKIGGTKKTMARIPATHPVHNDPPPNFFSNQKFIEILDIFG